MKVRDARRLWIDAQKLNVPSPFGEGSAAVAKAIRHLGFVQIDTINVIERCHHHVLYSRIPGYQRLDLRAAQSREKTVFEYFTHALGYLPTENFRYFMPAMKRTKLTPSRYFAKVKGSAEYRKVHRLIKETGATSIRDIDDDILLEKAHPWGSRKPSKKALEWGFYAGEFTVSERIGMLKRYELTDRHFGWERRPDSATETEVANYRIDRALTAQGFVSLDSICYMRAKAKPDVAKELAKRVARKELVPVKIDGVVKPEFFVRPADLERKITEPHLVHLLSPYDPLIVPRKRLQAIFDYEHIFEAYVTEAKRKFGYFGLPVLADDQIVAVIDLKADRVLGELKIQQWTWLKKFKSASMKKRIEEALDPFAKFQFGD